MTLESTRLDTIHRNILSKQHLVSLPFILFSLFRTIEGAGFSAQWRVGKIRPKVNIVRYFLKCIFRLKKGAANSTQVSSPVSFTSPKFLILLHATHILHTVSHMCAGPKKQHIQAKYSWDFLEDFPPSVSCVATTCDKGKSSVFLPVCTTKMGWGIVDEKDSFCGFYVALFSMLL